MWNKHFQLTPRSGEEKYKRDDKIKKILYQIGCEWRKERLWNAFPHCKNHSYEEEKLPLVREVKLIEFLNHSVYFFS